MNQSCGHATGICNNRSNRLRGRIKLHRSHFSNAQNLQLFGNAARADLGRGELLETIREFGKGVNSWVVEGGPALVGDEEWG